MSVLLQSLIVKTVFCLFFVSWLLVVSLAEGQTLKESNQQPNTVANPVDVQAPSQETASSIGRAVSLEFPLNLDGILDESIYTTVQPMSDFIQVEPMEGLPATEVTEVWVFFDDDHMSELGSKLLSEFIISKKGCSEFEVFKGQESFKIKSFIRANAWALFRSGKSTFKKGELIECFNPLGVQQ